MRQSRDSPKQVDGARNWHAHVMHDGNNNHPNHHARYKSLHKSTTQMVQEHRKGTKNLLNPSHIDPPRRQVCQFLGVFEDYRGASGTEIGG